MSQQPLNRLDRLERIVESLVRTSENLLTASEQNTANISTLTTVAQNHEQRIAQNEALMGRLDAILERLIYPEGREEN